MDSHLGVGQQKVGDFAVGRPLMQVQPEQIGAFWERGADAGQLLFDEADCEISVGGQIVLQRSQPLCAGGVGGGGSDHAEEVDVGDDSSHAGFDLTAQGGVLDDGKAGTQPGDVKALAGGHQRDGALGNFWVQAGDWEMLGCAEQQVAVDLVGADHQVSLGAKCGDFGQLGASERAADGVVRVAEQKEPGLGRAGCGQPRHVQLIANLVSLMDCTQRGRLQRPSLVDRGGQKGPVDRGIGQNAVAWGADRAADDIEPADQPGQQHDLLRADLPAVELRHPFDQGLFERFGLKPVAKNALLGPLCQRRCDRRGGCEIHIGHPHGQDVLGKIAPFYTV